MTERINLGEVEIAYREYGEGSPPLLLLHGFTGSSDDWADVAPHLASHRRVVTYDHRGHGDSTNTGRPESYTFDALLKDLAATVEALGLGPFHLLGHSMGGVVAMRYALEFPDQVRSLVLMDTAAAPATPIPAELIDFFITTAREKGMEALADVISEFIKEHLRSTRPAEDIELLLKRSRQKITNMDVEALASLGLELRTYDSMLESLGGLVCPITVIVGENDHDLRASADQMAAVIPGAGLVVIAGAGHSPQEEKPQEWITAVERHLGGIE